MSQLSSDSRKIKSKEEYSRNVKKLKIKLLNVQSEIVTLQNKISTLSNTSNDKMIAMKISKFCKERRFTPEMLFRFADKKGTHKVSKIDLQETFATLGLKLGKEEYLRLYYIIDDNLSGDIEMSQYNGYLQAFGIKKQYNPTDLIIKDVLEKLDIDRISPEKRKNLMNYEEFIKYCSEHFPNLKNKQLAIIFNRLERNSLINLQDLIDYLQDQQQQKKKKKLKKKKTTVQKSDELKKSKILDQDDLNSLKYIIQSLLRQRIKSKNVMFYSSEFMRLEKQLNKNKGQLVNLFKEIDKKRRGNFRGSFGYNELINYYIEKEEKSKNLTYAFQLMGQKLKVIGHTTESVVAQYTENSTIITQKELQKFFGSQFQIIDKEYQIISKLVPRTQQKTILIQNLLNLFNIYDENRKVYIRPNLITTRLVFRTNLMALRCCLQIQQKLNKAKQSLWDDYEFGPTQQDEFGNDSIDLPLPTESIFWERTNNLGMVEFYNQNCTKQTLYSTSPICPNQIFVKTLFGLISCQQELLFPKDKINYNIRDIEEQHLTVLFKGIYPTVFHHFSKYGIYVFKFFIAQKWKYVIIDNKIPCSMNRAPFFSSVSNSRYSYLSLIEKAYAKIYGSYKNIYSIANFQRYIIELSNSLPIQIALNKVMPDNAKNIIWTNLQPNKKDQQNESNESKSKKVIKQKKVMCLSLAKKEGDNLGLANIPIHCLLKLQDAIELEDSKSKNKHKSHRLLFLRLLTEVSNQKTWNTNWNRFDQSNKYGHLKEIIQSKLKNKAILEDKLLLSLNYKLFRSIFNVLQLETVDYSKMIILRKKIQFQELPIKCRYEITSKYEFQFIMVLNQTTVSNNDTKIGVDVTNLQSKEISHNSYKDSIVVQYIKPQKKKEMALQIYVQNWKSNQTYSYNLTLYMMHPRYELKQRDRHLLFRLVSPYEEEQKLLFSDFQNQQKQYLYRNIYKAADRRGCCGCL